MRLSAFHHLMLAGLLVLIPGLPAAGQSLRTSARQHWGRGYFPNVSLTTHEGRTVRFFDDLVKDRVVVINFIYTSCPDTCPLETARLAEVHEILGDRVGRDVFMYSITIDPVRDTPSVLAEYRKRYQAGAGWTFLTGKEADIILLRKKLGLYFEENDSNPYDHNLSMIIGNQATGRWMRRSPFENPYVLAAQIGSWLHNWKEAPRDEKDYSHAPKLRDIGQGEYLFRTRCNVCHVMAVDPDPKRTGPNLLGVTERRDREWLMRWIQAPDEMLARKDPLATQLFLAYKQVPMPNMRLSRHEVGLVLDYVAAESRRVAVASKNATLIARSAERGEVDSCCQKAGGKAIVDHGEASPAPSPSIAGGAERREAPLSLASMLSMTLGCILGAVALLRGRRA